MNVKISKDGRLLVVRVEGDIDHHSAEEIRRKVDREFEFQDCRSIVFDFAKVDFMDSSGIGMLVCRYKTAREKAGEGGKLYAAGVSGTISKIFELSGLDKIATRTKNVEEAAEMARRAV